MTIWKEFTDEVIQYIDKHNTTCVFLLLGNFAKGKSSLIRKKDRIVTEVHPSPLAQGFVGSNVFQRVEKVLGRKVNWSIEKGEDELCKHLEKLTVDPSKQVIYLDCDPKVFGSSKIPVTLDLTPPKPVESKPKRKMTRLERMCEDPQTKGEEAVKIYVEYCKEKNLPIAVEDINAILEST